MGPLTQPDRHELHGVRLGRAMRHVLLQAPHPETFRPYVLDLGDRPLQESGLRAVRKLERLGLVESRPIAQASRVRDPRRSHPVYWGGLFWRSPDGRRRQVVFRRGVWLTWFGFEIVRRYRQELENGVRIRWSPDGVRRARATASEQEACCPLSSSRELAQKERLQIARDPAADEVGLEPAVPPFVSTRDEDSERWRVCVAWAVRRIDTQRSNVLWDAAIRAYQSPALTLEFLRQEARMANNRFDEVRIPLLR